MSSGSETSIHPAAIVEDGARLGPGCVVHALAIVRRHAELGAGVIVHPGAVIGGDPQDLKFDPATESFRHYRITLEATSNIRRLAVDSKNQIWSATWGSLGYQNGSLFKIDPGTGQVERYKIEIPYTNPYDVEAAPDDSLWIATDNHVLHFDPASQRFVFYPVTTRTDIPKLAVTRDGAVWFAPRNAGQFGGYGGAATALYPDKDKITSYAAYFDADNPRNRKARHQWPVTPVKGERKLSPGATRNPCEFAASVGLRDQCEGKAGPERAGGMTIDGGAAHE